MCTMYEFQEFARARDRMSMPPEMMTFLTASEASGHKKASFHRFQTGAKNSLPDRLNLGHDIASSCTEAAVYWVGGGC